MIAKYKQTRKFPEYRNPQRTQAEKERDVIEDQRTTIKFLERRNDHKTQTIRSLEMQNMNRFGANFEDSSTVEVQPGYVVDADAEVRDGVAIRTRGELRIVLDAAGALDLATQLANALEAQK